MNRKINVFDLFHQDKVWEDGEGNVVHLDELDNARIVYIHNFIMRHAEVFRLAYALAAPLMISNGAVAQDMLDNMREAIWFDRAETILENTPLMESLKARMKQGDLLPW